MPTDRSNRHRRKALELTVGSRNCVSFISFTGLKLPSRIIGKTASSRDPEVDHPSAVLVITSDRTQQIRQTVSGFSSVYEFPWPQEFWPA